MGTSIRNNRAYGIGGSTIEMPPLPIVSQRAPRTRDRAEVGTIWVDVPNDDAYVLTSVGGGGAIWINAGGGSGTFTSVTTTAGVTAGTTLISGTTTAVGTSLLVGTTATISGLTRGVVQSTAAGLLSSTEGTDGQILISSTAGAPAWATLTAGAGINLTNAANSVTITATGAVASTFPTDAGTATPAAGAVTVAGGTNMGTAGAGSTVTINLDASPSVAGSLTAGVDFTMTSGVCTITGSTDAAQTIYLRANAGVSETIDIHADQGTGLNSINVHSDVGGITLDAGLASADAFNIIASDIAGGIDIDAGTAGIIIDTTGELSLDSAAASNYTVTGAFDLSLISTLGSVVVTGGEAVGDAVQLTATDAAGGITLAAGTGGITVGATNGNVAVTSGTGTLDIGVDASAHVVTVGSTNTTCQTVIQSGTGDITITSTDAVTIDSVGVLELNSSAGVIGIGNDAIAQDINIATGAAAKVLTLGNTNTTSGVVLDSGSGDITANATLGSVILNSTIDAADCIYLHANGGTTETIRLLSTQGTASASVHLQSTVGGCAITAGLAGAASIVINASDAAGGIDLDYGTGGFTVDATDGAFTMQTGTGSISLGADAVAKTIAIGNVTGATDISLDAGTGGIDINAAGIVTMTPAVDSQAALTVTINANVGVGTFTGQVTGAGAQVTLTVTNSVCTVGSAILCSVSNIGANDCRLSVERITPGAGSFTVQCQNNGAAALNGDILLTFFIIAA